jgi:ABC-type antimicrobial peptide transport system permease subunit
MGDYRSRRPDAPPAPEVHAPFRQTPIASLSFVARTQGDPVQITGAVRAALARQAPSVALASVRTFGEVVDTSTRTPQLVSRLTALFGLVAAMLAAVGVYGLLSYTTAQRRRELSIRAAVGASGAMLVSLVLREGLALTTIGLVAGAALAWGLSGLLSSLLYGVSATDPSVWLGAAAGLGVCALLGYALPAMRASRVEPANVLRAD